MIAGWQDKIDAAQREKTAAVGSTDYPRLGHGANGSIGVADVVCGDCAVLPGQLHVRGCTRERCPRCMVGQRLGCECFVLNPHLSRSN